MKCTSLRGRVYALYTPPLMALKSDGLHDLFFAKLDDVETLFGPGRLKTFRLEGIVLLKPWKE